MKKQKIWSLKLSTATVVLIPAAVGINYVGKAFADFLKLPLWLDSIGTVISGMLAGPIAGGLCGAINNILYGITINPVNAIYAITNACIGLVVGLLCYKGFVKNFGRAFLLGLVVACTASVVSTPLNMIFYGGQTGNVWGDAVYAVLSAHHVPQLFSSFIDEFIVDLPDKLVVTIVSFLIYKALPKKLAVLFKNHDEIQELH